MFDALSSRLQGALSGLNNKGRLDEESIAQAMREIRLALIEADVNLEVVRDFVAKVSERAVGDDVLKSLTPAQQVVKIVSDELTEVLGTDSEGLKLGAFDVVVLAGLQGSGKTTTAGKLALQLRAQGRTPGLIPADLQRPAAIDQLEQLGAQIDVPVFRIDTKDPVEATKRGLEEAKAAGVNAVIVDTAGRIQVDEDLMDELARVTKAAQPTNTLLVLDSMTGQEAVNVALAFEERIDFDGVVLTKIDGDARGGAALSVRAVTGKPILYVSTGEKLDAIEVFHPDRMASRILGMGDIVSLAERAEQATTADEQAEMEKALRAGQFTFEDFLKAYRMLQKMGPLGGLLKMIPGAPKVDVDDNQMKRVEAMILSMTPRERTMPHVIDGQRRLRIAKGSGAAVQEVNKLLESRKMMEKMMKGGGGLPGMGGLPAMPGAAPGGGQRSAKLTQKQKKKKRKAGRR